MTLNPASTDSLHARFNPLIRPNLVVYVGFILVVAIILSQLENSQRLAFPSRWTF